MSTTPQSLRFERGLDFALMTDHTLEEIADKITASYDDQANVVLPIIDVYSFAMMTLNGTDLDDLTKLIESTRANYSAT